MDEIFKKCDVKISIKTRIGKDDPEEFARLLDIYNQYPVEELIIHPRVQKDFYKNNRILARFMMRWRKVRFRFAITEIFLRQKVMKR